MRKQKLKKPRVKEVPSDDLKKFELDIHAFLDDKSYVGLMKDDERRVFLSNASSIFTNPAFFTVVNQLMNIQACHSVLQAPTSQLIMFDRAGINVLKLLKEEFQRLDSNYRELVKGKEKFDEDDVI